MDVTLYNYDATYLKNVEGKKKFWHNLLYADLITLFVTRKYQKIPKLMKIVNIDQENLHIFRTT